MAVMQHTMDQLANESTHSFEIGALSTLWMDGHDVSLESLIDNSAIAHSPEARRRLRMQRRRLIAREGT